MLIISFFQGLTLLTGNGLLWKIRLLKESLAYLDMVAAVVYGEEEKEEEEDVSDDEDSTVMEGMGDEEKEELTTCTFANTNKEFHKQHW